MKSLCLVTSALLVVSCTQNKVDPPVAEPATSQNYFTPDPATASNVSGFVRFRGKPPAAKAIVMDAEEDCQGLHSGPIREEKVQVGQENGLANAFVYVKSGLEGKAFAPSEHAVRLEQRGCMFVPRVIALRKGQTLDVKNSDPVSHNIHPMPQNNREWNQQQSPGAPDLKRRFGFAEVMIPVRCNVHAWMKTYIGVLDHPYFAVTTDKGDFELKNLPPGEYAVAVWHETLGELTQKLTLSSAKNAGVNFDFK